MMSRLSSRSLLRAAMPLIVVSCSSGSGSAGREDVDDEVDGVGALDPGLRAALAAVALLRRDGEQHPAAALLDDDRLVEDGGHLAGADYGLERRALAVSFVEVRLRAVHLAEVVDRDVLALLHRGAGALDEGGVAQLAVGLRGLAEVQGGDRAVLLDHLRSPRRRRLGLALGP